MNKLTCILFLLILLLGAENPVFGQGLTPRVDFSAIKSYDGFDAQKFNAWDDRYDAMILADSSSYSIPFKSVTIGVLDSLKMSWKSL
ncbi:MAG: hypothetical protein ACI837_003190, partial [Crocinitomicaceae bacterium]